MIRPEHYGIVEMAFTGLVVLGLAGWQLWSVSREIGRDRARKAETESAERARHPVGEHPADDG